jgi:hypothetical protein
MKNMKTIGQTYANEFGYLFYLLQTLIYEHLIRALGGWGGDGVGLLVDSLYSPLKIRGLGFMHLH